ncbi:MAG: symmetrical bis(5'-nucleosyl)-tetraphosphatase [Acidiferrobacterales bacterium]
MGVYAIGDVQGCFDALQALLRKLNFEPARDRLWFTGDLVNRGPQSADVLRFVMALEERAVSVLGNHDLHLLAVASGAAAYDPADTFADVLDADDRELLLDWLRQRPLLHYDAPLNVALIHAGLLPQWDIATATALAAEVEAVLRGGSHIDFFTHMYGDLPNSWDRALRGWDRLRVVVNALTRLRYCDAAGCMDLVPVGAPGSQPPDLLPWFEVPTRRTRDLRIVFGHWSTLDVCCAGGVVGLDSGCCWGGSLTAVRLDSERLEFTHVRCRGPTESA